MVNKVRVKWQLKNWKAPPQLGRGYARTWTGARRLSRTRRARGSRGGRRSRVRRRARASVGTNSWESMRRQSEDNVLQRALNAGRG